MGISGLTSCHVLYTVQAGHQHTRMGTRTRTQRNAIMTIKVDKCSLLPNTECRMHSCPNRRPIKGASPLDKWQVQGHSKSPGHPAQPPTLNHLKMLQGNPLLKREST